MKKMISAEEAKAFIKKSPAKKKRKTEIIEELPQQTIKVHKGEKEIRSTVSAGTYRAIAAETIARVCEEIWPNMQVRDEKNDDKVDVQLAEMAYILSLTMATGNDQYSPRQGLRIKETDISDTAKLCQECK